MTIFLSEDAMTNRRLPAGCDQQGRHITRPMPAEAYAAEVVPDTRPAALSMGQHRKNAGRVAFGLIAAPAVAAAVGIVSFIAQHWPG